ncbi:hypothetical protein AK830_g7339 [Neonectria ditissima]|uniref:Uncharacterized protein n=1 Tax=Neonectria ditissima TaxID=78410 RepID=A0A0N8H6K2_9HYPO|nr:hypothetical protein AK830_g7339 [Neonectria ditissima]
MPVIENASTGLSTPKTQRADIEEQLMTATKLHDDYWDDFCALMRKVGKKLDAEQATKEELQRKHA